MDAVSRERMVAALRYALEAHAGQTRRGTAVPYVSHLLHVAGLVLDHGGDGEQAAAALLHDAVEDCEDVTLEGLRQRFGAGVARIVADCTDTGPGDAPGAKRPWRARKEEFLGRVAAMDPRSALVCACDKLHNLSSMVGAVRAEGRGYLDRFHGTPEEQVWYFTTFAGHVRARVPERLHASLAQRAAELAELLQE